MKFINIINKKFGKLTVIKKIRCKYDNKRFAWECICECGNTIEARVTQLKNGEIKTCGCGRIHNAKKHGMSKTIFYRKWKSMKNRCYNKKDCEYHNYGGKGIVFSDEWLNFEIFKKDMYKSYLIHVKKFGVKNTTIDRIDSNKNYDKSNCRWATWKEQSLNQPKKYKLFKAISPGGEIYFSRFQTQFANEYGLCNYNLNGCLIGNQKTHKGWKFEYIINNIEGNS